MPVGLPDEEGSGSDNEGAGEGSGGDETDSGEDDELPPSQLRARHRPEAQGAPRGSLPSPGRCRRSYLHRWGDVATSACPAPLGSRCSCWSRRHGNVATSACPAHLCSCCSRRHVASAAAAHPDNPEHCHWPLQPGRVGQHGRIQARPARPNRLTVSPCVETAHRGRLICSGTGIFCASLQPGVPERVMCVEVLG